MSEVHRKGNLSLHVLQDAGVVVVIESTRGGGAIRYTTADDPTLASARRESEGGLSANEVCRRYAERAGVDFETAAAAVLDALEAPQEADSD